MATREDCIFCKIVAGEIPAAKVYEDERAIAFRDINPQAPTHALVIPRSHVASLGEAGESDEALLGHLLRVAARMSDSECRVSASFVNTDGSRRTAMIISLVMPWRSRPEAVAL